MHNLISPNFPLALPMLSVALVRDPNCVLEIDYTNYRGAQSVRYITGITAIRHGMSEFHREEQWLVSALDIEKNAMREFAVRDIHSISKVALDEVLY